MTTGRTVLYQKGNSVDIYRSTSCLPLLWKLMTEVIADSMYRMLEESNILSAERKGCRKKSRGTKDQLLIDKMVLTDSKRRHKNLVMAWVDYKKVYDMIPHSWIVECLKMAQVPHNVVTFLQWSMVHWKTERTSCGETLGTVNIKMGIFQGGSLSPLIFGICIMPLSKVLGKARAGYMLGEVTINHLLFMYDLKIFAKSKNEIDSL